MDLNHLYSRHQISLIRAAAAKTEQVRTDHLARVDRVAEEIDRHRLELGAVLASTWDGRPFLRPGVSS